MIRILTLIALLLCGCAGTSGIDDRSPRERLSAYPHLIVSNDATYLVGIRFVGEGDASAPPFDEPYALEIAIERGDGDRTGLANLEIEVDCTMPQHGHGMNVIPGLERLAPGRFIARGFELFMEGEWLLTIDVTAGGEGEASSVALVDEGSTMVFPGIYTERTQWWIEPQ